MREREKGWRVKKKVMIIGFSGEKILIPNRQAGWWQAGRTALVNFF